MGCDSANIGECELVGGFPSPVSKMFVFPVYSIVLSQELHVRKYITFRLLQIGLTVADGGC